MPNTYKEIWIDSGPSNNTIGGTAAGAGNVIIGNSDSAIELNSAPANVVQGNLIGLAADGATRLGSNSRDGVAVYYSAGNTIGGTSAGARNVVSGNSWGITLHESTNTLVQGNFVGTDATGVLAIGNLTDGIWVGGNSADNTIGGSASGAGNTVAYNGGVGIADSGLRTILLGNPIYDNSLQAIDVGDDGPDPVDPRKSFFLEPSGHGVEGVITWTPDTSLRLDVYASSVARSTNRPAAERYLGSVTLTTDAEGVARFEAPWEIPSDLPVLSATSTGADGQTSELFTQSPGPLILLPTDASPIAQGVMRFQADSDSLLKIVSPDETESTIINLKISATVGLLTLASFAGLAGAGQGTGTLVYKGTVADLTRALDGLQLVVPPDGVGRSTLSVAVWSSEGRISSRQLTLALQPATLIPISLTPLPNFGGWQASLDLDLDSGSSGLYSLSAVSGYLNIRLQATSGGGTLSLLDPSGRIVLSSGLSTTSKDVASLILNVLSGTYFLRVTPAGHDPLIGSIKVREGGAGTIVVGQDMGEQVRADFNGDGIDDVAMAGWAGFYRVYMGVGGGEFIYDDYPSMRINHLSAADFDGDGNVDLVIVDDASTIWWLRGLGDGTFGTPEPQAQFTGLDRFVFADLNGDGRTDLVATAWQGSAGSLVVSLAQSDGALSTLATVGLLDQKSWVEVRDADGDGKPDLLLEPEASGLPSTLYSGLGGGHFAAPISRPSFGPARPGLQLLANIDLSRDGLDDWFASDPQTGALYLFRGEPNGGFAAPVVLLSAGGRAEFTIRVAGVDDDGRTLLPIKSGSGWAWLRFLGDGSLDEDMDLNGDVAASNSLVIPPNQVTVADFNGDGYADIAAISSIYGRLSILLGLDGKNFAKAVISNLDEQPLAIASADVNGDGRPDLIIEDVSGISVRLGLGDGSFAQGPRLVSPNPDGVFPTLLVADFNGDGIPDLLTNVPGTHDPGKGSRPFTLLLAVGRGDGSFETPRQLFQGIWSDQLVANPVVLSSDVNGDGLPDLIVSTDDGVVVLQHLGNAQFHAIPAFNATTRSPVAKYLVSGDFNGDGRIDLVAADPPLGDTGSYLDIVFLAGNGDGTFAPPRDFASLEYTGQLIPIQLDGDPAMELVAIQTRIVGELDQVEVFDQDTQGSFGLMGGYPILGGLDLNTSLWQPAAVVSSDVNGDGRADIIAVTSSGDVIGLSNTGEGNWRTSGDVASGRQTDPIVADLDGDGIRDLIVINDQGQVLWRRGRAGSPFLFNPPVVLDVGGPARAAAVARTRIGIQLVVASRVGGILCALQYRDGFFFKLDSLETGEAYLSWVTAGDVDGDGYDEIAYASGEAVGVATFGDGRRLTLGTQWSAAIGVSRLVAEDVDGNGTVDLMWVNRNGGTLNLIRNLGGGNFDNPQAYRADLGFYETRNTSGGGLIDASSEARTLYLAYLPGANPALVAFNQGSRTIVRLDALPDGRIGDPQIIAYLSFPPSRF